MTIETNFIGILVKFLYSLGVVGAAAVILMYVFWAVSRVHKVMKMEGPMLEVVEKAKWNLFFLVAVGFVLLSVISAVQTFHPRITPEQAVGKDFQPKFSEEPPTYREPDMKHDRVRVEQEQKGTANPDATFDTFREENGLTIHTKPEASVQ